MNGDTVQALQTGRLIYFFLELLSAALVFSWPLRKRSRFWFRLLGCFLGWSVLTVISAMFNGVSNQNLVQSETIILGAVTGCGILFFASVLSVWSIHSVNFRESLYCGACAYLMEHMAYCIRLLCMLVLPKEALDTGSPIYFLVHIGVYSTVYLLFARKMIQNGRLMATARDSLALTLTTLAVVVLMSSMASACDFEYIHAAYAVFSCGAVLFGQLQQQKQIKSESELVAQRQMWALHK